MCLHADASGDSPEPMDELSPGSSSNDVYTDVISSCVINAGPEAVAGLAAGTTTLSAAAGVELLPGHSRNSSSTSHSGSGSASGYGSLNSQSLHSRQSSTGELGHFRFVHSGCAHCRPSNDSLTNETIQLPPSCCHSTLLFCCSFVLVFAVQLHAFCRLTGSIFFSLCFYLAFSGFLFCCWCSGSSVPCAGFHRGPFGRLASQSSAYQPVYLSYSNPLDTSGPSRPVRVVAPSLVAILAAARVRFRPRPSAIDCAHPVRSVRLWAIGIVATLQPLALAALKPRP